MKKESGKNPGRSPLKTSKGNPRKVSDDHLEKSQKELPEESWEKRLEILRDGRNASRNLRKKCWESQKVLLEEPCGNLGKDLRYISEGILGGIQILLEEWEKTTQPFTTNPVKSQRDLLEQSASHKTAHFSIHAKPTF